MTAQALAGMFLKIIFTNGMQSEAWDDELTIFRWWRAVDPLFPSQGMDLAS